MFETTNQWFHWSSEYIIITIWLTNQYNIYIYNNNHMVCWKIHQKYQETLIFTLKPPYRSSRSWRMWYPGVNVLIGVFSPTPLKNDGVRLDHHPNYWGKFKIHVPVTTNQRLHRCGKTIGSRSENWSAVGVPICRHLRHFILKFRWIIQWRGAQKHISTKSAVPKQSLFSIMPDLLAKFLNSSKTSQAWFYNIWIISIVVPNNILMCPKHIPTKYSKMFKICSKVYPGIPNNILKLQACSTIYPISQDTQIIFQSSRNFPSILFSTTSSFPNMFQFIFQYSETLPKQRNHIPWIFQSSP